MTQKKICDEHRADLYRILRIQRDLYGVHKSAVRMLEESGPSEECREEYDETMAILVALVRIRKSRLDEVRGLLGLSPID